MRSRSQRVLPRPLTIGVIVVMTLVVSIARLPAHAGTPPNDGFVCYRTRTFSGAPRFTRIDDVPLTSGFASGGWDVIKRGPLCLPADVNGSGIVDAATHLQAYGVKPANHGAVPDDHTVVTSDLFGELTVVTNKADRLLVPSAMQATTPPAPPDPQTHAVDHYHCYRTRVPIDAPGLPADTFATVRDAFNQPTVLQLRKTTRLCVAVSAAGAPIENPTGHLMCYKVRRAPQQAPYVRVLGLFVNNALEQTNGVVARLTTVREDELCMPALINPSADTCGDPPAETAPNPARCAYAPPAGAVYHVATGGSDLTGTGAAGNPWATITFALEQVPDGSTILVAPGTYVGRVHLDASFSQGVTVRSTVPYQARLRNDSTVVAAFTGQGITLEGFDIAHSDPATGPLVIQIQDLRGDPGPPDFVRRITLRNNVLHDSRSNDILKINNGAAEITVEGNVFYNQHGDDEHIDVNGVSDVVIQDNIFFNDFAGSGRANDNDTSSYVVVKDSGGAGSAIVGSARIAIRRNVFARWEGKPGAHYVLIGEDDAPFYEARDVVVENNLLLGDSPHVIRAAFGLRGAKCVGFRHNTVTGDLPSLAYALRLNAAMANPPNRDISLSGNVWSDPTATMLDFTDSTPGETTSFLLDRNLYWNGGQAIPVGADDLVNVTDDAQAVLGNPKLPSTTVALPRWDANAGQFADGSTTICAAFAALVTARAIPQPGSAALAAGDAAAAPKYDIVGHTRPVGTAPDIGAYEVP